MSDFKEILSQTKKQIKEVSVQEVRDKLNPDNGFTLLDVREGDEWEQGHLDQAIFLPRGFLEVKADKMLTDKSQPIVVYCAGGVAVRVWQPRPSRIWATPMFTPCVAVLPSGKTTVCRLSRPKKSAKTRWRDTAGTCAFPKSAKKVS